MTLVYVHLKKKEEFMNRDYRALIEEHQQSLYKKGYQTNVGMLIRDARLKRYLTQGELAKGICSVSYLSKIESGQHENSNVYLQEIVQRLGLELSHYHTLDYSKTMQRAIQLFYQMDIEGMKNHRAEFKDPIVPAECLWNLRIELPVKKTPQTQW
jgi:transcriptional regulator with XRE-family HTH domain